MEDYIKCFFDFGLSQKDIVTALAHYGFEISERHLRRLLRKQNLRRRKKPTDSHVVIDFLQSQLETSGKLHGYRWMHEKCKLNGIHVNRKDICTALSLLDPEGCLLRKRRKLYRRVYASPGPNFTWHIDGYDKIKPFGFAISGCIDGFSRHVIWLNVYTTNNDPRVIAGFYVEALKTFSGAPRIVRTDCGTENVLLRDIQAAIQSSSGEPLQFISGSSHSNQRIECFWGQLRKQCMEYWICFFHRIQDDGLYTGDFLDKNILQFCFMAIIQDELDEIRDTWNHHKIRKSRRGLPCGRPNVTMHLPSLYNTDSFLCEMEEQEIQNFENQCLFRKSIHCDDDVHEIICMVMFEDGKTFPNNANEALDLYIHLRDTLRNLINLL